MLTTPLLIASAHWSRSIINRDTLWPVVDQPEMRSIGQNRVDGTPSALRFRQDEEDGHR
jgi:hypothetical protein